MEFHAPSNNNFSEMVYYSNRESSSITFDSKNSCLPMDISDIRIIDSGFDPSQHHRRDDYEHRNQEEQICVVNPKNQPFLINERERDNTNELSVNIYRYKFTQEFMDELYKFSKIHQYDNRKDFKEAWDKWIEEKDDIIVNEIRRLETLKYEGCIIDKMFKSARYYFRKKNTTKPEPKERRQYLGVHKELLDAMDKHIRENIKDKDYKPSNGFTDFCKENVDLLKKELTRFVQENEITDADFIKNKIKKTYKNRYFMLVNKKA